MMARVTPQTVQIDGVKRDVAILPEKKLCGMMFSFVNENEMNDVMRHLVSTDKIGRVQQTINGQARNLIYLKSW